MPKLQGLVPERLYVSKFFIFRSLLIAVIKRTIYKYICFDSAGSNGMGQAQSQSSGSGCEECYGSESSYANGT